MSKARRQAAFAIAMLAATASSGIGAAERWKVEQDNPEGTEQSVDIAIARDDRGDSLRVYRDDENVVRAIFRLRDAFDTIADGGCPTFQIDREAAVRIVGDDGTCDLRRREVHLVLGQVEQDELPSNAILDLMNGSRIRFRYRVAGRGYREATFSLRGSKQAINDMLGREVRVVEN